VISKEIVILAAGKGTRLGTLTEDTPKCLIPIEGRSLINRYLDSLESYSPLTVHVVGGFKFDKYNPFDEIEKYDIYYWKTNKLFKPIGIDICDDPTINKSLPQQEKPRLYLVKSNKYKWIYNDNGIRDKPSCSVRRGKNRTGQTR